MKQNAPETMLLNITLPCAQFDLSLSWPWHAPDHCMTAAGGAGDQSAASTSLLADSGRSPAIATHLPQPKNAT